MKTYLFPDLLAFSVKESFNVIMTVLVILFLFMGGIKLAGAFNERHAEDRKWGIIGGIGMAVSIPIIWGIMSAAGWAPQIDGSSTALP